MDKCHIYTHKHIHSDLHFPEFIEFGASVVEPVRYFMPHNRTHPAKISRHAGQNCMLKSEWKRSCEALVRMTLRHGRCMYVCMYVYIYAVRQCVYVYMCCRYMLCRACLHGESYNHAYHYMPLVCVVLYM